MDPFSIDSSIPLCNPKRTSGVSETGSSVLEDVPSTDWSSDSLAEELELSPPPKPPLPLKSILSDLGNILVECIILSHHFEPT